MLSTFFQLLQNVKRPPVSSAWPRMVLQCCEADATLKMISTCFPLAEGRGQVGLISHRAGGPGLAAGGHRWPLRSSAASLSFELVSKRIKTWILLKSLKNNTLIFKKIWPHWHVQHGFKKTKKKTTCSCVCLSKLGSLSSSVPNISMCPPSLRRDTHFRLVLF